MQRRSKILIGIFGLIALAGLVVVALPAIGLGIAASSAQRPSEILRDINAFEREPSQGFAATFAKGSSEQDLFDWLRDEDFDITASDSFATRTYTGMPCTRAYRVTWASEAGLLTLPAKAELAQYGCL